MNRRDLLRFVAFAAGASLWSGRAWPQAAKPAGLHEGETFSRDALKSHAAELARSAYQAPDSSLPASLRDLNYEQYAAIRFHQDRAIWSAEDRGFTIEPLHRGFIYAMPIALYTVEDGRVLRVPYDPNMFEFGSLKPPEADAGLGFSGFRLRAPFIKPGAFDDFAVFQGASYFRAIAAGQNYGTVARGLAINTGDSSGEQFPVFRSFWIERPPVGSKTLVVHALLDSDVTTGAYSLTLTPGDPTTIDVDCTLYPRSRIEHVGIAPMNSMYMFGDNDHHEVYDARLAVHSTGGLQMLTGNSEWIWRPVQNPETLQISSFIDKNPKGFGLLQRDRRPEAYEDAQRQFERQPSVWVEPAEGWGDGVIQLVEIPSDAEIHDNIVSYWRPKAALEPGNTYSFRYRSYWCYTPPQVPNVATVRSTRIGATGSRRLMVVDFEGPVFSKRDAIGEVVPTVSINPGKLSDISVMFDADRSLCRLSFVVDPQNETYSEMRATLMKNGAPISETWLYRWTP